MGQFIIRRTCYSIITLLILSLTIFTVVRLTGDPATLMAEPGARAADLARVRAQWGLDRSWPIQYYQFVQNILSGNLGISFNYRMSVSELYFARLPTSLQLAVAAALLALPIGCPAARCSPMRVDGVWDQTGKGVALWGLSIPGVWLGLVLTLVFSVYLEWLPAGGKGDLRNLLMPALSRGW